MDRCAIVDAAAYERIPDKYKSDHSSMSFVEAAFAGNFKFPAMTLTSGGTSKQLKLGGQATENLLVALRNVIPSHPAKRRVRVGYPLSAIAASAGRLSTIGYSGECGLANGYSAIAASAARLSAIAGRLSAIGYSGKCGSTIRYRL